MEPEVYKIFKLENLEIKVRFRYCEKSGKYLGEYPDFEEAPLFTMSGKRIVTAVQDKCDGYKSKDNSVDCGSCDYYETEQAGDLIGVCNNEGRKSIAEEKK